MLKASTVIELFEILSKEEKKKVINAITTATVVLPEAKKQRKDISTSDLYAETIQDLGLRFKRIKEPIRKLQSCTNSPT